MKYVINYGAESTENFQTFMDYCSAAFNILRTDQSFLLSLFALVQMIELSLID